jgi:hypothetical protein
VETVFVTVGADLLPSVVFVIRAFAFDRVSRHDDHAGVLSLPRPPHKRVARSLELSPRPTTGEQEGVAANQQANSLGARIGLLRDVCLLGVLAHN